jgi:hypothetical protein
MGYVGQSPAVAGVTSSDITDGTIVNADIKSDAAIAMSKTALSAGTGLTLSTNTLNVDASQAGITTVGTIGTGVWEGTTVAVDQGGTGATSLSNLITLATHTTGDYVQNITAGTGLTSSGATSGENIAHSLSVDAAQTQITSVGTIGTGVWEGTTVAVDQGGTGATALTNLITLGTHTTGDYAATITAGTGLTSTGATSGESIAHSLSVDAAQTQITSVGALNVGSITSGFTSIDVGSGGLTTTGAIAGGTIDATTDFTIGSTVITDDVITFTPTSSDTVTMTAATNGAFSLVTVDAAAAAANIVITADGTVDINSAGVLTLDSGAAINIEPASGSAILLDGTISIDEGVVTGATSITSTAFVGALTGNADTATLATTVTITDNESTSETNAVIFTAGGDLDGGNLGLESDGDFTYTPNSGTVAATTFSGALSGNATTATALATGRTIAMTGDVAWTSASFTGSGNVTGAGTIQANAVEGSMLNNNTISGQTEITSGLVAADELLYDDGGVIKKIGLDNFVELTPALATEDAVADGDYFLFLDGSSTGNMNKDAVHDLATLFAGAGMTATSSVLNVIGGDGITANANDVAITAAQTTVTSMYNAALKIGRDTHNQFDFATDNAIKVSVNAVDDEFRFVAGGDFHADADVIAFSTTIASDLTLKKNIVPISSAMDKVMQLTGVTFDWKREDRGRSAGLIAQDVEKILPQLVKEVPSLKTDTMQKHLNYNGIIGLLVEAVKELAEKVGK